MPRRFEFHRAYRGPKPFWYTLERAGYKGFAVVAWREENGLMDRDEHMYYERFNRLDYAEQRLADLIEQGEGASRDGRAW